MIARILLFSSLFWICLGHLHAAVNVGSCESNKHVYSTISAAIEAASPGEEVRVCAGSYAEKLTIQKPLTIRGIGSVSLEFPPAGLMWQPAGPSSNSPMYAQVVINEAGGPVLIKNISIAGGDLFITPFTGTSAAPGEPLCESRNLSNYWGIVSIDSFVALDHVSVNAHSISPNIPEELPSPYNSVFCGNGIEFQGGKGVVTHSVVSGFGTRGISGAEVVDNTLLTSTGGTGSEGIVGASTVVDNTVTGPGYFYVETSGIVGGDEIRGNVVQGWALGVQGEVLKHNTLIKNEIAVSGAKDISDILVVADPTYPNPACFIQGACEGNSQNTPLLPTTAIDMACADGTRVRNNSIVSAGIGFANVDPNRTISPTNLLYQVTTTSTPCPQ